MVCKSRWPFRIQFRSDRSKWLSLFMYGDLREVVRDFNRFAASGNRSAYRIKMYTEA